MLALRTLAECDAFPRAATPGCHAVVAGKGFIGSEVAASLRMMGVRVRVVLPDRVHLGPLPARWSRLTACLLQEPGLHQTAHDLGAVRPWTVCLLVAQH